MQVSRWWQLKFEPKWKIDDWEAIETREKTIISGSRTKTTPRCRSERFLPPAFTLRRSSRSWRSGAGKPVKTFSIGFEEPRYSETHFARQVAERYKTDHHEFIFGAQDLIRVIPESCRSRGRTARLPRGAAAFGTFPAGAANGDGRIVRRRRR